MKRFTYWLEHESKDCGMCDPPMSNELALKFLKDYLLGENWYVCTPESHDQCNTAIVYEILYNYSSKFRKEMKEYRNRKEKKRWRRNI